MNKKSIISVLLALAAMTGQAQNTYTLNFDTALLGEELSKENVKIDSFCLMPRARLAKPVRLVIRIKPFSSPKIISLPTAMTLRLR